MGSDVRNYRHSDRAAAAWRSDRFRRLAISLVLAAFLSAGTGCGTTPKGDFERLEIVVAESGPDSEPSESPTRGETAMAGAAVGAASGLFYSGLLSLACGPLFAACFGATAPVTVGATAVAGGAMGLAVSGVPEKEAAKIASHLQSLGDPQKLGERVAAAVSKQFPASRLAPPGKADARLRLAAEQLGVVSGWGEKFGFALLVNAGYEWKLDQAESAGFGKRYFCQTELHTTEDWLREQGRAIEQEVKRCTERVAAQIHDALKEPPSPAPVGFEGDWN